MRLFLCTIASAALVWGASAQEAATPLSERKAPQTEVNAILASVNGTPISLVDILGTTRDREFRAAMLHSGERLEEEIRNIRREAVDNRIDQFLVLAEYRKNPTPIPVKAIEEELDKIAERMGVRSRSEFTRKLRESGTTVDTLYKEIEEYLIFHMMIYDRVRIESNITPREVYEYYQAHREEFVRPEQIALAMIMLKNSDSEYEAKSKIVAAQLTASPETFAALAQQYSTGPAAENGGYLGEIERKRLRAEFAAAMPVIEGGKIYGPIQVPEGIVFLQVREHKPESRGDFRTLSSEIRKRIDLEQREKIKSAYLLRLREDAIIRYFF